MRPWILALVVARPALAAVLISAPPAVVTAPAVVPVLPLSVAAPSALSAVPAFRPLAAALPAPSVPLPAAPSAAAAPAPASLPPVPPLGLVVPRPGPDVRALDAFWDGRTPDKRAVDAFAPLARSHADAHGRVTPALQGALTRIESARARDFTRGARRAWQTLVARLGAKTTLPFLTPPDSVPYWQTDGGPLSDFRSAAQVPAEADVVIIGAGLTGASAARRLADESRARGLRVVVVDAGPPAGQASGRNGGNFHLIPENYIDEYRGLVRDRSFYARRLDPSLSAERADAVGEVQARAVLRLAAVNRDRLLAVAREDGLAVDLTPNGSVRVAKNAEEEKVLHEEAAFARSLGFDLRPLTASEVDAALGLPPGTSPHGGRLSTLDGNYHPYRYVHGALQAAVDRGVQLFTHTPVLGLSRAPDGRWAVATARGTVSAAKVVMAANAFTASLLPDLAGGIVPYRSQVQVTEHVAEKWGGRTVTAERGDLYGHHPNGARYRDEAGVSRAPLLLGGGKDAPTRRPGAPPRSRATHELLVRERDRLHPELEGVPPSREWSGTMGFTPDSLPAIGELEPGLIVAAGFNGYGGVYTQAAGLAAAEIALTGRAPAWAPPEVFSPKRLRKPAAVPAPRP